jgi:uncharacterized protein RhaS with RHS repeats
MSLYSPTLQRFISEDPIEFAGGDVNLYAYVGNNPIIYIDPSGFSKVVKVVKLVESGLKKLRTVTIKQAQNIRRNGGNILAPDQKTARQIEAGAFKRDRDAGDMLHHEPHPNPETGSTKGRYPHYQHDNVQGHTFYGTGKYAIATFLAPKSMELSGRKDTTNMQMVSAGLWDIADTIDPIGLTDAIDGYFGLSGEED